jgi:hypothetical protein
MRKDPLIHSLNSEKVWMLVSAVVAGSTRSNRFTSYYDFMWVVESILRMFMQYNLKTPPSLLQSQILNKMMIYRC